ncbi:MAG: Flp family type IVb pilin, partial [Vicinamibacterales bacterium]
PGPTFSASIVQEWVVKNFMRRFLAETEGQDLIEYALLAALIALAAITAMQNLGTAINTKFGAVSTQLGS